MGSHGYQPVPSVGGVAESLQACQISDHEDKNAVKVLSAQEFEQYILEAARSSPCYVEEHIIVDLPEEFDTKVIDQLRQSTKTTIELGMLPGPRKHKYYVLSIAGSTEHSVKTAKAEFDRLMEYATAARSSLQTTAAAPYSGY